MCEGCGKKPARWGREGDDRHRRLWCEGCAPKNGSVNWEARSKQARRTPAVRAHEAERKAEYNQKPEVKARHAERMRRRRDKLRAQLDGLQAAQAGFDVALARRATRRGRKRAAPAAGARPQRTPKRPRSSAAPPAPSRRSARSRPPPFGGQGYAAVADGAKVETGDDTLPATPGQLQPRASRNVFKQAPRTDAATAAFDAEVQRLLTEMGKLTDQLDQLVEGSTTEEQWTATFAAMANDVAWLLQLCQHGDVERAPESEWPPASEEVEGGGREEHTHHPLTGEPAPFGVWVPLHRWPLAGVPRSEYKGYYLHLKGG